MMKFVSPLGEAVEHASTYVVESKAMPGVRFRIRRMSFQNRIRLLKDMGELLTKYEFLRAGTDPTDQLEAQRAEQEIALVYLRWGLAGVEGLTIDGVAATAATLLEDGPEELTREALVAIAGQLGLTDDERKN